MGGIPIFLRSLLTAIQPSSFLVRREGCLPKRLRLVYDMGDDWLHDLRVERIEDGAERVKAACLEGANACPPEDCGGPWGYADLLRARSNPKNDADRERAEWLGADFDPTSFDLAQTNRQLSRL